MRECWKSTFLLFNPEQWQQTNTHNWFARWKQSKNFFIANVHIHANGMHIYGRYNGYTQIVMSFIIYILWQKIQRPNVSILMCTNEKKRNKFTEHMWTTIKSHLFESEQRQRHLHELSRLFGGALFCLCPKTSERHTKIIVASIHESCYNAWIGRTTQTIISHTRFTKNNLRTAIQKTHSCAWLWAIFYTIFYGFSRPPVRNVFFCVCYSRCSQFGRQFNFPLIFSIEVETLIAFILIVYSGFWY